MAANKNYCTICQRDLALTKFWKSESIVNKNGLLHICSDCVNSLFEDIYKKERKLEATFEIDNFTIIFDATSKHIFKKVCRLIDIKYSNVAYEATVNHCVSFTNTNKKLTKIFGVYKNKSSSFIKKAVGESESYDTSDLIENSSEPSDSSLVTYANMEYLEEKYGYGYSKIEYQAFERKYKKLILGYSEKTALHTERLLTYIIHKTKGELAAASGNVAETEKWEKLAQSDATAAKLNVSQLNKSDITGGIDLIPQLVEAVEERASLIPIMPKLKAQPYDDADIILWGVINKLRRNDDRPAISYREIWDFYDEMLKDSFKSRGFTQKEVDHEISLRYKPFKDLGEIYKEPLYGSDIPDVEDEEGDDNVII